MRICLLTEGSYPYVVGGVSSWTQMLIKGLPEYEFVVYSIGAEEKDRGKYKYKLPDNLVNIQEEFLDDILNLKSQGMKDNCSFPACVCGPGFCICKNISIKFNRYLWTIPLAVCYNHHKFVCLRTVTKNN